MNRLENEAALVLILDQLKIESVYLDTVVESSLEMQGLLRERPNDAKTESDSKKPNSNEGLQEKTSNKRSEKINPPSNSFANNPDLQGLNTGRKNENQLDKMETDDQQSELKFERSQRVTKRLEELRTKIENDFVPVIKGRRTMVQVLKSMTQESSRTPTLSELAAGSEEPLKTQLKAMRNEIRAKLNQIHSITMGNQAVLLYTLDFYNRLLAGLSGDARNSNYYNANGHTQQHSSGNIVRTNC
jgi:hypothetical protein